MPDSPNYRRLRIAATLALLFLGIFFRVTHLGTKPYWHDEVYTSLWLSGVDLTRRPIEVFDGREVSAQDFLRYQHLQPRHGLARTIRALARNDPQHPPLYYGLTWLWARGFQDSTTALRALSALFGLLILPATFWLCAEAFSDRRAAWLGTLLIAVSPIHVLYAQEAREYSLWALAIVLSTAALLFASRSTRGWSWGLYGLTVLLGLYSHGLHPLVMLAHGGWIAALVVIRERRGDASGRRLLVTYLAASAAALILFAPWAWNIVTRMQSVNEYTSWMREPAQWGTHLDLWVNCFASVFVDGMFDPHGAGDAALTALRWTIVVFSVAGLSVSWRYPQRKAWLIAVALIGLPLAVLATPDLLSGGQRSTQGRFLFPGYVGLLLATVHSLMPWLNAANRRARVVGIVTVAFLLTLGVASCAAIWCADTWRNKGENWCDRLQAVDEVNECRRPLVLIGPVTRADSRLGDTLGLGHLLRAHVRLRAISESTVPAIPSGFTNVYFVNITDEFVAKYGPRLRLERTSPRSEFYRCPN